MTLQYFIFRNTTIEPLFANLQARFSGYDDISTIDSNADVYIWAYMVPFKTDEALLTREIETYTQQLSFVLSQIPVHKSIFALTLYQMHYCYVENSNIELDHVIEQYNQSLYSAAQTHRNLKVLDFKAFCQSYSKELLVDWKFYYLSQMQVNPKTATSFQQWFKRQMDAIAGKRKKCLALDLDNTLWGGILGEDGPGGIKIGNTYPGSAYLDFQLNLLELSKRGVILTICSKNNESDVEEAWKQNPYLQIKKEQLAAYRINWRNKAENIMELAQELNIGMDSFVFIDDHPTERELVKQMLPMVEVPDFPSQPYMLPAFFARLSQQYFQMYELTDEDKNKLAQYKANSERVSVQKSFTSFEDYLRSLEIELTIREADEISLPRIAQMTQKTNQFNLTTQRYTDTDIVHLLHRGARIFSLSVKDKFGDSGLTGVAIVINDHETKKAYIDSFLLSCRILGKGIENAFLAYVVEQMKLSSIQVLSSTYKPTPKNAQVRDFYDRNGFDLLKLTDAGEKHYDYDLGKNTIAKTDWYQINP